MKGRKENDFIFPPLEAYASMMHILQRCVYKPVMKALGFGDKDLYAVRHSF
jgi:hypothetical protein